MKKITLIIILFMALTLSACSEEGSLKTIGLDNMSGKEILTGIADGTVVVDEFAVTVYDDELVVILEEEKIFVDMPKDEFYVSVAPYVTNTHECLYHSATGCRGELKDETFFVEFVDNNGNIIISDYMQSLSNGFIDLWLPRNIEGTLSITFGELTTSKIISTSAGQPTCETTMQLA